jgi:hypothetical protein
MGSYARIARLLRAPLAAALLLGMPATYAASIVLESAIYSKARHTVVVKGKLDGIAGSTTVTLRDLATKAPLGTAQTKGNLFAVAARLPSNTAAPCTIAVEANIGSDKIVGTAQVRSAQGVCRAYTVTLNGVVTDQPIPFATVTVTIGGITYTTVADKDGRYTLPVTSASLDALLKIEAVGSDPVSGEPIEFVNLIGSFSRMLNEQLADGSADANITNVTTASYVLVLQANGGTEPTSEAELRTAETSVDATELLQLAALIKLIVDDPDYSLPPGEASLLSFVSNPEAVNAYLETVPQEDLDASIASILQDSNLVAGFAAADIPPRYFAIPATQPGYLARLGQILEFNGNGSGRLLDFESTSGQPINEPYTWIVQNGRLTVTYDEPITSAYFTSLSNPSAQPLLTDAERARIAAANGPNAQVSVLSKNFFQTYTRVADGALVDAVSVESRYSNEVLPFTLNDGTLFTPSLPPYVQTGQSGQTLRASVDVQASPFAANCPAAAGATCVPGQWLASFLYSPGVTGSQPLPVAPYGDVVTFAPGGTVTGLLAGLSATWTVDGAGALVVSYPSGWQQKLLIVDTLGIEFGVFNEFSRGDDRYATYTINVKAAGAVALTNSYLANAPGRFWQSEISSSVPTFWNPDGTRTLSSYFGWQFFDNSNTAINVGSVALADCGGDGQQDDPRASLAFSNWQPAGTGIGIPRGNAANPRLRTWYPAASTVVDGERQFYVIESESFVGGPRNGQLFIPPRINFLREIAAPWVCTN